MNIVISMPSVNNCLNMPEVVWKYLKGAIHFIKLASACQAGSNVVIRRCFPNIAVLNSFRADRPKKHV